MPQVPRLGALREGLPIERKRAKASKGSASIVAKRATEPPTVGPKAEEKKEAKRGKREDAARGRAEA